jgi:2-polyprenyl-3-methyl-5-hydroxy-6-metoxy-1,4-benzoquinol methylase
MASQRPPAELIRRVGWNIHSRDPQEVYERRGREQWEFTCSLLPEDWSFAGRRVLDFGCGIGRMLRNGRARARRRVLGLRHRRAQHRVARAERLAAAARVPRP